MPPRIKAKPVALKTSAGDIPRLTEHLFRHESGRLVSILTGIFGISRLQLAEDVVQEALVRALQTWPYYGIPDKPTAWLMQTARNLALDVIRRENRFVEKQPDITATLQPRMSNSTDGGLVPDHLPLLPEEMKDEQLRLMFACCHPDIPPDDQTALALKTLCGFSPAEIARAFLTTEAAVLKRLTRARQRIRDNHIPFEIPAGDDLTFRLDSVLHILYLLFNEGYKATSGDRLTREDLCSEAIRLATLLANHPVTTTPRTHALLSLMLLHASRLPTRTDTNGSVLRLQDQDRSLWDQQLIALGIQQLALSAAGQNLSEYHIQAAIAATHATAKDYKSTDWARILHLYDHWTAVNPSPVIALNRAVAVANVHGAAAGMAAVEAIPNRQQLNKYYLTYAVLAEFEALQGNSKVAANHLKKALELTGLTSEQSFLLAKLHDCEARAVL